MKKLEKLLLIIYILLLFYLTKDLNILPLTISFSMYILYSSIFSSCSIKNIIGKLQDNKYYYSRDKIFIYTLISIILIGILLTIISYVLGDILSIEKLNIINIFMSISLISYIILKITSEYLDIIGYKKISRNLLNIYNIVVLSINIILSILLFKVFKVSIYINIIVLYLPSIIVFIIISIMLYLSLKKNKYTKKREENKINYISSIKNIIISNKIVTIYNIINSSYIYISIIILYYVLSNKYNYSYDKVGISITNTYFYGLIIVYLIYKIIKKYINIDYNNIQDKFNNNINKIIKVSLNICILLLVIALPLGNLLVGSNILSGLIPLLFIYIIYDYIINISIKYNSDKITYIILIIGLLLMVISIIPLINSLFRMGYSLILGSIISIILGLSISIILGLMYSKYKLKLNLLHNFNNILNIIYESIIYSLVLLLCTLIVSIDNTGIINNILTIIFYLVITILFYIMRKILTKN